MPEYFSWVSPIRVPVIIYQLFRSLITPRLLRVIHWVTTCPTYTYCMKMKATEKTSDNGTSEFGHHINRVCQQWLVYYFFNSFETFLINKFLFFANVK